MSFAPGLSVDEYPSLFQPGLYRQGSPRTTISSSFAGLLSALYGSICTPCHFPPSDEPLRYDGVLISIVCAIPDNNIRAQAKNRLSTNIHSEVSGKHSNLCMPLSYCARFVITSNVTMHYTSKQHAFEQSIRLSFCEELCVYACVPFHRPWMSNSSTTCGCSHSSPKGQVLCNSSD